MRGFIDWWIADADYAGEVLGHPELTAGPAGWPRADRAGVTRYYVRRGMEEIWGDTPEEVVAATGARLDAGIVRTLWMTPEEVRASASRHRSPLVVQCMEDYLAGRRHSLEMVHTSPEVMAGSR